MAILARNILAGTRAAYRGCGSAALLVGVCLVAAGGATAASPPTVAPAANKAGVSTAPSTTQSTLSRRLTATVGARGAAAGLSAQTITMGALLDQLLAANQGLRASAAAKRAAGAFSVEREAVFDPGFFTSLSYKFADTHHRGDMIERWRNLSRSEYDQQTRDGQLVDPVDNQLFDDYGPLCRVVVDGEVKTVNNPMCDVSNPAIHSLDFLLTSSESRHTEQVRADVGVNWLSGSGLRLAASVGSLYNKKYAFQAPSLTSPLSSTDPFGWGGDRPWASSAAISLTSPLPYTKGYGLGGTTETYALLLAQTNERVAEWNDRALRNATITQALLAYWDLIQAAQRLDAVAEQRGLLNEQRARVQRLENARQVTAYDAAQIDAALLTLDQREEEYWSGYLVTSARLTTLLAGSRKIVLLPGDSAQLLARAPSSDRLPGGEVDFALHPDVQLRESALEASRLTTSYRENQTLPDISVTARFSVGQSDSAFGYSTPGASLTRLFRPDSSDFFIGLRYVVPLGNNQAESSFARARLEEQQSRDRVLQAQQRVAVQSDNALNDVSSARGLVQRGQTEYDLASFAFDRVVDQRRDGQVSEYEVLNKLNDVLSARLTQVAAQVELEKAHVRLLYARGVVAEAYAQGAFTQGRPQ